MVPDHLFSDRPLIYQHIVLLPLYDLLGHEEVVPAQVNWLKVNLQNLGYFFRPILVVKSENVILDGHHRVEALKELGGKKIPCILVKYLGNNDISLGTWYPIYSNRIDKKTITKKLKIMKIKWQPCKNFNFDILNDLQFGFILKAGANQYYKLEGSQQEIYKKFLRQFNPEHFDYVKTLKFAFESVEKGHSSFAMLRSKVTKEEVIKFAKEKKLFAPKTTRHILSFRYQDIKVPLKTLMS
ncbi:MAG: hypothetical protein ACXAC8_18055 [Candidatus Hodarchaeales archaeon]|jgi:uncharacterized protein (DUF1015 family)